MKLSFKRALYRAGIGGLHLHDLRHEATSRFFEKGLNVMEVASVTGHKTLQMLKRYTHLSAGDLAARLGQGFLAGTQAIGYHLCQRFFAWETCGS
ncbi:MAG: tyrosine-type recombinase/integrase [Steroidobacteraceae bacterium]